MSVEKRQSLCKSFYNIAIAVCEKYVQVKK